VKHKTYRKYLHRKFKLIKDYIQGQMNRFFKELAKRNQHLIDLKIKVQLPQPQYQIRFKAKSLVPFIVFFDNASANWLSLVGSLSAA